MHKIFSIVNKIVTLILFIISPMLLLAQGQMITNFIVKENLTQNGKLAIIAVDSLENPVETINGQFRFSLNGFQQELAFHDGIAVVQHPLESSTFVFFKHKNQEDKVGKLYYIHKKDDGLKPIKINGLLLLIIPAVILVFAYMFKKFLTTFVVLGVIYAYFHYAKGLGLSQIVESIFSTLKSFI